jgi:hypothetical protein
MKPIFYFVSAGRVRQFDRDAATAINEATGNRVVFRNGTCGDEAAEPCAGTAGKCVPPQYKGLPHYDSNGQLVDAGDTLEAQETAPDDPGELNALGLPEGCPDTREGIKEALEGAGVEFHGNSKTEKLVDLYRESFLS